MPIKDQYSGGVVEKQWARIITVDTRTRRIEVQLKDFGIVQIAVWEVPNGFRWPIEGELWLVVRENGIWFLRAPQQSDIEGTPRIEDLNPGDSQIGVRGTRVEMLGTVDVDALQIGGEYLKMAHIDGTGFANNQVPIWNTVTSAWAARAPVPIGWYDVKDYGAKGDGITNDYPAVIAAINAAIAAGGGVVYFPPGTYKIGQMISTLGTNVWFMGATRGSVILRLADGVDNHLINITGNNCMLSGLVLDGNRANNAAGHGLRMCGMDHTVQNLIIHDTKGYGIGLAQTSGTDIIRCSITNVFIYTTGEDGIDSKDVNFSNLGNSLQNVVIKDWGLDNADQTGIDIRGYGWTLSNIRVYDVHDDDCGIRFREGDSGITGWGCDGSSLVNFYVQGETTSSLGIGLSVASGHVAVSNGLADGLIGQSGGMTGVSVGGIRNRFTNVTARNGGIGFLIGSGSTFSEFHSCHGSINNDGFRIDANDILVVGGTSIANLRYGINVNGGLRFRRRDMRFSSNGTADINPNNVIASAAALAVPGYRETWHVSGTTTVTSISGDAWEDRVITLIFDGILTFTDGSNLKLDGNFVTNTNYTITLRYDGTNWYEVARSVN